jgi:hypothetical protein
VSSAREGDRPAVEADCRAFRARLAQALEARSGTDMAAGAGAPPALARLSWHQHLPGCAACRALLEAEDALEALLESLPRPELPPALAARVLARLRPERTLDALLELDRATPAPPAGLVDGVLAGLAAHRGAPADGASPEAALDRLLELVPAPASPEGLAERTLERLASHRSPVAPRVPVPARRRRGPRAARPLALALAAALAALLWAGWLARDPRRGAPAGATASVEEVPPELLASLELLESWELLVEDEPELELATLDEVDLLLLELESGS